MNYFHVFHTAILSVILIPSMIIAVQNVPEKLTVQRCFDAIRVDIWWHDRQLKIAREQAIMNVGEKPNTMQIGHYKHGRYVQFSFDMRAFLVAMVAGSCFRGLYSIATCGTEYKKFKQAAFTPGVAKSFLFWAPAVMAYQFVVKVKDHDAFVQKMSDRAEKYNPHNQFEHDKIS